MRKLRVEFVFSLGKPHQDDDRLMKIALGLVRAAHTVDEVLAKVGGHLLEVRTSSGEMVRDLVAAFVLYKDVRGDSMEQLADLVSAIVEGSQIKVARESAFGAFLRYAFGEKADGGKREHEHEVLKHVLWSDG